MLNDGMFMVLGMHVGVPQSQMKWCRPFTVSPFVTTRPSQCLCCWVVLNKTQFTNFYCCADFVSSSAFIFCSESCNFGGQRVWFQRFVI
jgi:hypothetical protein